MPCMHGWSLATYDTKLDTDANYLRCLDWALQPERTRPCASASPGTTCSTSRTRGCSRASAGCATAVEFEMLLGHGAGPGRGRLPRGRARAALRAGRAPRRVRRRDQLPGPPARGERVERELPLRRLRSGRRPALFDRERDRFLALDRARRRRIRALRIARPSARHQDPRLRRHPVAPPEGCARRPLRTTARALRTIGLTRRCSAFARTAARARAIRLRSRRSGAEELLFGGAGVRRDGRLRAAGGRGAVPAARPGFRNAADTDPALPANRAWAPRHPGAASTSLDGGDADDRRRPHRRRCADARGARSRAVRDAAAQWGALPARRACRVLRAAAGARGAARRAHRGRGIRDRQGVRRGRRRGQRGRRLRDTTTRRRRASSTASAAPCSCLRRVTVVDPAVELPARDPGRRRARGARRRLRRRVQARAAGAPVRGRGRRGAVGGRGAARRARPRRHRRGRARAAARSRTRTSTGSSSPARGRPRRCSVPGGPSCRCSPRRAARTR